MEEIKNMKKNKNRMKLSIIAILIIVSIVGMYCIVGMNVQEYSSNTKLIAAFDYGDGTQSKTLNISEEGKIIKPEDPEREGYVFLGWLNEGEVFDFDRVIKSNITLTALWEKLDNNSLEEEEQLAEEQLVEDSNNTDVKNENSPNTSDETKNTSNGRLGDVNGDGLVNETDIKLIQEHTVGLIVLTETQKLYADVNKDGKIDSWDALEILIISNKKFGDVNQDGTINIADAILVQEYIAQKVALTEEQKILADINKDGTVSMSDLLEISKLNSDKLGDVNRDGTISTADVMIVQDHLARKVLLTAEQKILADINKDGTVSMSDLLEISKLNSDKLGDVNRDGTISTADVMIVQDHLARKVLLTAEQKILADINKDGTVSMSDLLEISKLNSDKLGDVNRDGTINAVDKAMVQDYIAEKILLTSEQKILADINKDGVINISDLYVMSGV